MDRQFGMVLVVGFIVNLAAAVTAQEPQPAPPAPPGGTPVLPELEIEGTPPVTSPQQSTAAASFPFPSPQQVFDPVVDGWRFGSPAVQGYRAPSSTAGTLLDVPDADFPGTVNVVPEALIRDQLILDFRDVTRNIGGASIGGDAYFADRLFLRGMELDSRDFRKDGFLDPTFVPRDFQNVERVEILKGPASVLYGSGSPAGMVNLITKKPVNDSFARFDFMFGSWNQTRYMLDVNDVATESGNVMYRLNLAFEDINSFRDFGFTEREFVAPAVTWKIDESTRVTWSGEWHRDHRRGDQGMPAVGGNPLALPSSRYVGEPANDRLKFEEFRQTLMFSHDFSSDWTLQIGASSLFYEYPGSVTAASGNPLPNLFPTWFTRTQSDVLKAEEQSHSVVANLAGEFETFGLKHQGLIGIEYVYFDSDTTFAFKSVPIINAADPVYTNPDGTTLFVTNFPVFRQHRVGGYLQDLIELTPKWKVLGGVRFDSVDFRYDREFTFGPLPPLEFNSRQTFDRVSPRTGIVYQPLANDDLAFYFNYSRSFAPPGGGVYLNTDPLKPVTGEGYEAGVKAELLDGLSLNVAGFHNIRRNAELLSSAFTLLQVGEERAQGVEINLIGEITERWSALATYTYTDTRLSDPNNPDLDGSRQRNVPLNAWNLWTRYNLIQNKKHTFGLAGGLVALGERPANLENTVDLPSFVRWDAGMYYRRGWLDSSLYVENVFDTKYAASSINEFQIYPGAPATVRAQVGIVF